MNMAKKRRNYCLYSIKVVDSHTVLSLIVMNFNGCNRRLLESTCTAFPLTIRHSLLTKDINRWHSKLFTLFQNNLFQQKNAEFQIKKFWIETYERNTKRRKCDRWTKVFIMQMEIVNCCAIWARGRCARSLLSDMCGENVCLESTLRCFASPGVSVGEMRKRARDAHVIHKLNDFVFIFHFAYIFNNLQTLCAVDMCVGVCSLMRATETNSCGVSRYIMSMNILYISTGCIKRTNKQYCVDFNFR